MKRLIDLKNEIGVDSVVLTMRESVVLTCKESNGFLTMRNAVLEDNSRTVTFVFKIDSERSLEKDEVDEIKMALTHNVQDNVRRMACEYFAPTIDIMDVNSAMVNIIIVSSYEYKARSNVLEVSFYI